jgi:hypothetical protein
MLASCDAEGDGRQGRRRADTDSEEEKLETRDGIPAGSQGVDLCEATA